MALILKTDENFSDNTIPRLYRDSAITESTQFVFDALDAYSWAKQAAPTATDAWRNLSDVPGNASFSASPPGWSNGFTIPGGTTTFVSLPASGKVASGQKSGFLAIAWFKANTVAGGALQAIAGLTNGTPAGSQWLMYLDGANIVTAANAAAGVQINGNSANTVYQVALAYDGDGAGNFVRSSWRNGQLIGQGASEAAASIFQPTAANPQLGRVPGINGLQGTVYRFLFDTLTSSKSVAEIVAADWAANNGRFV